MKLFERAAAGIDDALRGPEAPRCERARAETGAGRKKFSAGDFQNSAATLASP
jgi:hypothetical protein